MTVRCTGESRLVDINGEKQDFECMLTALGLRHDDFVLRVRRVLDSRAGADWSCDYAVSVARAGAMRHVYVGGPAHHWVGRCAARLSRAARIAQPDDLARHARCSRALNR